MKRHQAKPLLDVALFLIVAALCVLASFVAFGGGRP